MSERVLSYIAGVLGLTATLHFLYKWFFTSPKWEKVGFVGELMIHPLKSAGCICVQEAHATKEGLTQGLLIDRSFIILRDGAFVTGRDTPKLVTLRTAVTDSTLTIFSRQGDTIQISMDKVNEAANFVKFRIRDNEAQGYDCGDAASRWLSRVLYDGIKQPRLIYKGDFSWTRTKRKYPYKLKNHKQNDTSLYCDCGSYMVMTQSSLDDLNHRIDKPVNSRFFRPPIVIAGTKPYDEDTWEYVKIGQHVSLRVIKPCERCLLTQIDPETGLKTSQHFECLLKYRRVFWPEDMAREWKRHPIFGAHCGIDKQGPIRVGDPVWVTRQNPPQWKIGLIS